MKVLVCGGRDYTDRAAVRRRLARLPADAIVIEGGADGADTLAAQEAKRRGVHAAEMEALWGHYSKRAGHLRNAAMLRLEPDLVIAFPGGKGTANCVEQAEKLGIPVERVGEGTPNA